MRSAADSILVNIAIGNIPNEGTAEMFREDQIMEEEIDSRLNKLDSEFIAQGLPEYLRPSEAFRSIYGNIPDGPARESLFDSVVSWFLAKYRKRIRWDGIVGRIPVLIRVTTYLAD
jgi:hypothetical protein